jgi:nucleoside-diphosphate-sugar epimerase
VYADEQGRSIENGSPWWPQPIRESQSLVPATDSTYGGGKVLLEETLLQANRLFVSALRPAAVCGPVAAISANDGWSSASWTIVRSCP